MDVRERRARMALCALQVAADPRFTQLVESYGALDVWETIQRQGESTSLGRRARGVDPGKLEAVTVRSGASFLVPGDELWPDSLTDLGTCQLGDQGGQPLGLWDAGTTLVADYSAGMRKKIHLACAMVHSPSILVLDEPFEAVDPISAQTIQAILKDYAAAGGTVVISSHVMSTVQRLCDHVAIINTGRVVAAGTTEQVAAGADLEQRFTELVGAQVRTEGLSWLRPSSS